MGLKKTADLLGVSSLTLSKIVNNWFRTNEESIKTFSKENKKGNFTKKASTHTIYETKPATCSRICSWKQKERKASDSNTSSRLFNTKEDSSCSSDRRPTIRVRLQQLAENYKKFPGYRRGPKTKSIA
eukprot:m.125146 g.125146  ORF g.125146 m.125146 type:complete len:128 (+) comp9427_c1_seq11:187-570(+)